MSADKQEEHSSLLSSIVKPGEPELQRWKRTFDRFAGNEDDQGKKYLSRSEFIDAIAPTEEGFSRINREQYGILFNVADTHNRGRVSFDDFVVFETLLKRPDADYQLAFQVFDVDDSGTIDFEEFKHVLSQNLAASGIPFDFDAPWIKLYLGKRGAKHVVGYQEFTQLIKGFQGERLRQAFHFFDKDGDGYITPDDFQRIVVELHGHKLSDSVLARLPTLCTMTPGRRIGYSEVIAFHNVIRDMDVVEGVIQRAVKKSRDGRIGIPEFLNEAASSMRYSPFTPMEADIVWHFASRGESGHGISSRLALADFQSLLDARWQPPSASASGEKVAKLSFLHEVGQSTYNFVQGGIAGGIGAFTVYPIDLVKTRLQNQRSNVVGEVMYRNAWDCVKKVYANEGGVRAFYRGVLPQLVGVAPEKAIKITVNELVRKKATDPETGRIPLIWEIIAGGSAGACQVSVTNPLEIVKIRLQMAGEVARETGQAPRGAVHIIKQLGVMGLYKGATACLWRDVPFSMIYFTTYAHLKKDMFQEGVAGKQLSFGELLTAAGAAGMPAAYLTTPADVIKTRMQSQARAGQTVYKGFFDGIRKVLQEEGMRALFKGGIARVIRSSPQFGVTLAVYEVLHKKLPYPWAAEQASSAPSLAVSSSTDISRIRARNGLRILLDCSSRFGTVDPSVATKGVQQLPQALRP